MPESGFPSVELKNPCVLVSTVLLAAMWVLIADGIFRHGLFDQPMWNGRGYRGLLALFLITFSAGFFSRLYIPRYTTPLICHSMFAYAILRIQVNWADDKGKFIRATLNPHPCSGKKLETTEIVTAPDKTSKGVFYVGAHDERPVIVSLVSMKRKIEK